MAYFPRAGPSEGLHEPPTIINDTNKVYSVAASCIVLGVIATFTVLLRLGTRFSRGLMRAEDYFIIPATIIFIGWTAMAAYMNLNAGVGKPLWEITVAEFSTWYKGMLGYVWLYPAVSGLIRISILLTYVRMFESKCQFTKCTLWILLVVQGVYMAVFFTLPGFICKPFAMFWSPLNRPLEDGQYCNNMLYNGMQIALHSTSFVLDFILLVFPMGLIFRLPMPTQHRVGVAIMFILGAGASIVAAYKFGHFVNVFGNSKPMSSRWKHYQMSEYIPIQWECYGTTVWIPSQLELAVSLIGTSLPALRQMFSKPSDPSYLQNEHHAIHSMVYPTDKGRASDINPNVRGSWPYSVVGDIESRTINPI